jgi:hypothetical protein
MPYPSNNELQPDAEGDDKLVETDRGKQVPNVRGGLLQTNGKSFKHRVEAEGEDDEHGPERADGVLLDQRPAPNLRVVVVVVARVVVRSLGRRR